MAKKYLQAVWGGDLAVCDALMSEDVRFIDSAGHALEGFTACSAAARAFNRLEPECRVEVNEAFVRGDAVMLRVDLHVADPRLRGDYLISVKFRGDLVCEWQTHRRKPVAYSRVLRREIAEAV